MNDTIEIQVRPYHVDLFRHVNNARYLEFLEEARWSFWESFSGFSTLADRGWTFMVVRIEINYRLGAEAFQVLEIRTELEGLGERSGRLRQVVRLKGADSLVADAEVVFVVVDKASGKALPMSVVGPAVFAESASGAGHE
ncbi:MAG: acyl-CoA thioesterase [Actinobacteria bacterium]|nr:acyl-CoA thioesterase [Actinomycetota bacterium]